jgi:hypothetical protein
MRNSVTASRSKHEVAEVQGQFGDTGLPLPPLEPDGRAAASKAADRGFDSRQGHESAAGEGGNDHYRDERDEPHDGEGRGEGAEHARDAL